MASIVKRGNRYRVLVRTGGHDECATFSSRAQAEAWGKRIEAEIDELRANGILQPRGLDVADLLDRYVAEIFPLKPWARSKSADLESLRKLFGHIPAGKLTKLQIINAFRGIAARGAGPSTVATKANYLVGVLTVARTLWSLNVPLQSAIDARAAMANVHLIGRSKERDRRVSDSEIEAIIKHFESLETTIPYADLVKFAVGSAMRLGEICRLRWEDLNETDRVILVRDRKDPKKKIGNDMFVPLTDRAGFDTFAIVKRQPRDGGGRIFPVDGKTISSVFPRQLQRLKIRDLHWHDLRHEGISRLFESGLAVQEVALISGHRSWEMLRRYTHVKAVNLHRPTAPGSPPAPALKLAVVKAA